MNRFGKILLSSVLAASLIVTPVLAAPDVNSIRQSKEASESALNQLKNDLSKTITKINQLEEELVLKGEKIAEAETDLEAAKAKEKEQYEAMKIRIRYMYEEGDTSLLSSLLEAKSISEVLNKAEYIQGVHKYDRKKLEEYVETKEKIANLKTELEEQQKQLLDKQKEFEAEKENIGVMMVEKQDEIAELDEQLQAAILQEAAERAAEERRKKEEEERRRREEEAEKNNNHNNNNNNNSGNNNTSSSKPETPSQGGGSNESKPGGGNSSDNSNAGTGNVSVANAIVSAAYSQLGVPYVWGGTTPGKGLDCSGLTQYAHRVAGISIARTSGPQGAGGKAVSNPQPGDIVCYSGHVGIYIGGGKMIHAPQTGDVVKISNVYGSPWYRRYW